MLFFGLDISSLYLILVIFVICVIVCVTLGSGLKLCVIQFVETLDGGVYEVNELHFEFEESILFRLFIDEINFIVEILYFL